MQEQFDTPTPLSQQDETAHTPTGGRKTPKRFVKQLIGILAIVLLGYILYSVIHIAFSPDRNMRQIYLVPSSAAIIVEASDPLNDWAKFNKSETWNCLKRAGVVGEVAQTVQTFDSIIRDNSTLLSLVGKRDLMVSLHKTSTSDWDFLAIVDMQKTSKMGLLKDQIETVLKMAGGTVTQRMFSGIVIHEMRDAETLDIIYLAFVENHVVFSYNPRLVEASITERNDPKIGLRNAFSEVEKLVAGKGMVRIYLNYEQLPKFLQIYTAQKNEYTEMFSHSMDMAGLYFNTDKEKVEMKGYSISKENPNPYVSALLNSGTHKMRAHDLMSARTAFYLNIGFDNPSTFVKELEKALEADDKDAFNSYQSNRKKIETLFGISLEEHFLSWMDGEFAMSQSEPGLLGREPELILAVRAKSIKEAKQKMEFMEKKVNNRTPLRIKTVNYQEYEVKYIEMKGFFRLFFGGMFDSFEKPYYTFIDDYVVFSNKSASLLSFIEDYRQKNLLKNSELFRKAYGHYSATSTVFAFVDTQKFFPQLKPMLSAPTWKEVNAEREVWYSFPLWSMQIVGGGQRTSLHYIMDYVPYTAPEREEALNVEEADEADKEMNENAETEKELMSELKRFYVEKFEGNVWREFYPEGAIRSEVEVKNGLRHGRYREYYEDGTLKVRGKYIKNKPKGTWKYYTSDGKFERKCKF